MQVYLQKLANLNQANNVPINLMRNVLGFSQVSKQKCKPMKLKTRGCTQWQKEDLHPKREGKKKIEPNQKSAESSVKRKVVKEFFL